MSEKKTGGFQEWYNTPSVKRGVGIVYSLGAAIVIIGALFKILHWPFASTILAIGMITEAILFAIGAFEKPFKEYHWEEIFDFTGEGKVSGGIGGSGIAISGDVSGSAPLKVGYSESIDDEDVVKLSDGIKNLSNTAKQLNSITESIKSSEDFARNIDSANKVTETYVSLQDSLNTSTRKLSTTYQAIGSDIENIGKNTKSYSDRVEDINKNLSAINTVYEIQLKNIQAQSESLNEQTDRIRIVNDEMDAMVENVQQIKSSTQVVAKETEKYKESTLQLTKQVAELNQVYGNMLNALS